MILFLLSFITPGVAQEKHTAFDLKVREKAMECRDQVTAELKKLITGNKLTLAQLFDTFYIPIIPIPKNTTHNTTAIPMNPFGSSWTNTWRRTTG